MIILKIFKRIAVMNTRSLSQKVIHIQYDDEESSEETKRIVPSNVKLTKSATTTKGSRGSQVRGGEPWEPKNWKAIWDLVSEMRQENPAAVDTMGAHTLMDPEVPKNEQAF